MKSTASVSDKDVYRNQDSRHFSQQRNKPLYIANILSGTHDSKLYDEIKKYDNAKDTKSPSPIKAGAVDVPKLMNKSPSENNDRNLNYLFNSHASHGGALERLNNEERLNFLSDANLSKIDNNSVHRRQEKSVDLDLRSGAILGNDTNYITSKVISSNMLSKYLTKFIGNKDFRTTEEREYAKCTFKPRFVNKKKFKNVNSKVSGMINEEDLGSRSRDIALFNASENIKNVVQYKSVGRGLSADGRFNNSISMSDGGFLLRADNDETSTISVLNEMRSIPTIYANKNVKSLGGILQFGYSHKYHEKKHYKEIIQPTIRSNNKANTTFFGSSKGLSLSLNESTNMFQSKVLTPVKSSQGNTTQRLFKNNLASKAEEIKNPSGGVDQEPEFTNYTPEQLEEIRKIHEIHFKLRRV
jgi:hypothetical protein